MSFTRKGKPRPASREQALKLIELNKGRIPWNKQESIIKNCLVCGKKIQVRKSRIDAKFCSHRCGSDYKKLRVGKDHPLYTRVNTICQWCGKTFTVKPAKIKYGEGKFCSRSCSGSYIVKYKLSGKRSSIELKIEIILRMMELEFKIQKQIDIFLVDFYLPDYKLVIECDGMYWHSRPEVKRRDFLKNRWFKDEGYKVFRLTDDDINNKSTDELIKLIEAQIKI